jgi:voltage-gated potassium channel
MSTTTLKVRAERFGHIWNKYSLWPLIALGVALVVLMTIPALVDGAQVDLDGTDKWASTARAIIPFVWSVFVADVVIRFLSAPSQREFVRQEWLEIVAVMLPYLPHLHVLQLLSVFIILASRLRTRVTQRIVIYAVSISLISWYVIGLGITESEGKFQKTITSLADGLWWSFELLTTGNGFDEAFPTTEAGRVLGVFGFLLSYAVIGGITAALVAWMVSIGRKQDDEEILNELEEDAIDVAALHDEVRTLRSELAALREDLGLKSAKSATKPSA